jgi:hypothetical protein
MTILRRTGACIGFAMFIDVANDEVLQAVQVATLMMRRMYAIEGI